VTKVVGSPGKKRRRLAYRECSGPCLVEYSEIGAVGQDATTARKGRYTSASPDAVLLEVVAQERHKLGVDGYRTSLAKRPVFECGALTYCSVVITQVYEGTNQIQRMVMGRQLLK